MTTPSEPIVGIDLGTTMSVVAHLDGDGKPRTVPNDEGELTTPSVVFFDRSTVVVGREAVKGAELEPLRAATFAKRDVGKTRFHKKIMGREFPPEVMQALILRKLKHDAELKLGTITKAVVTVPAYFNEPRRKATQDAGRMAGIEVIDIINEPTAAAIAYGFEKGFVSPDGSAARRERVLVYDLGGGTFDATLMEIDGNQFRAVATDGDVLLGGGDWDERIAARFAEVFASEHGLDLKADEGAWERLLHAAHDAKHSLSARDETSVAFLHAGKGSKYRLTRAEFESLTADLLDRTRLTIRQLLRDAQLAWSDVTRLLLVGGSSRMPMVQQMLEQESGVKPDRSLSPDEAVAHGAAIYAGLLLNAGHKPLTGMSVRNVNSHDLGVMAVDQATMRPKRRIMIPRNTQLPAEVTKDFYTARAGQPNVPVSVVEGGTDSGSGSTAIGTCLIDNLPADLPAKTPVRVTFRYGQDGRLHVEASLPSADKKAGTTIQRTSGIPENLLVSWTTWLQTAPGLPDPQPAAAAPAEGATAPTTAAKPATSAVTTDASAAGKDADAHGDSNPADAATAGQPGGTKPAPRGKAVMPTAKRSPATEPAAASTTSEKSPSTNTAKSDKNRDAPSFDFLK